MHQELSLIINSNHEIIIFIIDILLLLTEFFYNVLYGHKTSEAIIEWRWYLCFKFHLAIIIRSKYRHETVIITE